jgi:hypothetical protein
VLAVMGRDLEGDGDFALTRDGDTIRAEKTLTNGLRVVKEFEIGTNYLFKARVRWRTLPASRCGCRNATWSSARPRPSARWMIRRRWGPFGTTASNRRTSWKWFANRTFGCFPGTPRWQYEEGASNVVWAAVHNQFFALAAIPTNPAPQSCD